MSSEASPRMLVFTATFNERDAIEQWIRQTAATVPHADILIVDDSSPDGTQEIIERLRREFPQVTLISRPGKQGLASAHLLAMNYARDHDYQVLVTMDADGSHQPEQIPSVVQGLDEADFCIGTRTHGGSHQAPFRRRTLSYGANFAARVLLPTGLSEYTTSFRAFSPRAIHAALDHDYSHGGYAFFVECIENLRVQGVSMTERPIDFLDRQGGESKIPRHQIFMSANALIQLAFQRVRMSAALRRRDC